MYVATDTKAVSGSALPPYMESTVTAQQHTFYIINPSLTDFVGPCQHSLWIVLIGINSSRTFSPQKTIAVLLLPLATPP